MMLDREVSLTATFAWLLWTAVVAGLALAFVTGDDLFAYAGLACSAAAATVHVRGFVNTATGRIRGAFEYGREVERREQQQREIRSV